jgi:lipopolysaccharide transport system ATP-binding protein
MAHATLSPPEEITLPPLGEEGTVEILLERLDLIAGTYFIDVAVHARNGYPYDYHHQIYSFTVPSELRDIGVFHIPQPHIPHPFGC